MTIDLIHLVQDRASGGLLLT